MWFAVISVNLVRLLNIKPNFRFFKIKNRTIGFGFGFGYLASVFAVISVFLSFSSVSAHPYSLCDRQGKCDLNMAFRLT